MAVRIILKANIAQIFEKKVVVGKKSGKRRTVINVFLGENHYANGEWSEVVWWYVSFWDGDAERFEERGFKVGDYVEVDIFNIEPQAYIAKDGNAYANITGFGGYVQLIQAAKDKEELPQNPPPGPDEAVTMGTPETAEDIEARNKKGSSSKPA